ncbi:MAG: hypothetical protein LGB66_03380 [Sulfurovum sp.]|nr:hypothetical protein [Sulfurovum sp.]
MNMVLTPVCPVAPKPVEAPKAVEVPKAGWLAPKRLPGWVVAAPPNSGCNDMCCYKSRLKELSCCFKGYCRPSSTSILTITNYAVQLLTQNHQKQTTSV